MNFPANNQPMGDFPYCHLNYRRTSEPNHTKHWGDDFLPSRLVRSRWRIRICLIAKQKNVIGSMAIPIGSMVLLYMVTWIPSIYPIHVSINIPAPWILWDTPLGLEIVEKSWPIGAENRRGTKMGMALPFFPGEDPPIFRTRRSESCTSSEPSLEVVVRIKNLW